MKDMRVEDFVPAIVVWLLKHGAEETGNSAPKFLEYQFMTGAGLLRVLPVAKKKGKKSSMVVFTRFVDPAVAERLLGKGQSNPYTGKWNHYYFVSEGTTPQQAFDDVVQRLESVLPELRGPRCSRCGCTAKTAVVTRSFGREKVCVPCQKILLVDGQTVD